MFIKTPPEYVEVLLGDSLTLSCGAHGNPRPTVVWHKDETPIAKHEKIKVRVGGDDDDGGTVCVARVRFPYRRPVLIGLSSASWAVSRGPPGADGVQMKAFLLFSAFSVLSLFS